MYIGACVRNTKPEKAYGLRFMEGNKTRFKEVHLWGCIVTIVLMSGPFICSDSDKAVGSYSSLYSGGPVVTTLLKCQDLIENTGRRRAAIDEINGLPFEGYGATSPQKNKL